MDSNQIYQTPDHTEQITASPGLDFTDVKELWNYSRTLRSIGALFALGAIIFGFAAAAIISEVDSSDKGGMALFAALFVYQTVGVYVMYKRPLWGRIVGMVICSVMLIGFPVGTLIGVLGLRAVIKGKALFGDDRLIHKDLKKLFKDMKRDRKAQGKLT